MYFTLVKTRLNALTATRAVAALMVFIHHFGGGVFPFNKAPVFFHSGNVAVSYFFVLSGFVLYISYHYSAISYRQYIARRIGRIAPVYLLALAMSIGVAVAFHSYAINSKSVKEIVFSALFLQAFIPSYPLVLNGPAWTISVEMFFYALFPALLLLQKKQIKRFIALTATLYVISQTVHLYYYPIRWTTSNRIMDIVYFNPVIHISQFLIGMIGGYLFSRINENTPKYKLAPLLLFVVIVLLIAFKPDNISYQTGLIAPVFMLFILTTAMNNPRLLNVRVFVFAGEISYGIYILQQPVHQYLEVLNTRHMHLSPSCFFYCSLGVLLLFSACTYYLFELPLRRLIAALGSRSAGV